MGMEDMGGGQINERGEFVRGRNAPETERGAEFDSFESFNKNSVTKQILEDVSLEYLKNHDTESFEREFTGELDSDGYLIRKDGKNSTTKPSMNIGGGEPMEWVINKAKEKLNNG